jgi:tetratricopeptide (TPR) repeat protein
MVSWVERRARRAPCCLVVEDLHWADPSTLEFLALLVQADEPLPLLVLMTCRTGEEPAHVDDPRVTTVDLQPLGRDDAVALVAEIADGPLPAELTDEILERSDAVPLYVCELTRAVLSSGVVERGPHGYELRGALESTDVPSSLQDSLMMRLDGLGRLRSLASIAATIGRTFDVELLREVAETGDVDDELDQMVAAGVLVRAEGQTDRRLFTFGHALVREAAYHSITKRTRRQWHGRIADALADRADAEATMQAHHLTEARRFAEAVDMWATAARLDFANGAYDESIAHYERGLALIPELEPEQAAAREFELRLGVGLAYATRIGYASAQAEQSYQRANELAQALTGPEGFPAVLGLWAYYQVRSDPVQRRELGVRCHALSQLVDDVAVRLEGLSALSTTLGFEGDFEAACDLMTEGIELFDRGPEAELTFFMPQHPVAGFCAISGPLLWARGDLRAALERYERCRQFAEQPTGVYGFFTSGYAHTFGSWLCGLRGDYEAAAAHAQAAMAVASEHGFLVWMGAAVPHLGIATAMLGDTDTGIRLIREGVDGWRGVGSGLFVSYWQHGLGLAYEAAGDVDAALDAVDAGIEHSERHAERFHLAELHRLRARLLAARGDDDATRHWRLAARIGRRQGARLFELLALSDLAAAEAVDDLERARLEELATLLHDDLSAVPTSPTLLRSASWG